MTDGTTAYNAGEYRISILLRPGEGRVDRLAFFQGHELAPDGATAVSLTPGRLRSMMLKNFGVTEGDWRDALTGSVDGHPQAPDGFGASESPR